MTLATKLGATTLGFYWLPPHESNSSLSAILERRVDPKFYLSARACSGILRRAARRGRELPELLREALEKVAGPLAAEPEATEEPEAILSTEEE